MDSIRYAQSKTNTTRISKASSGIGTDTWNTNTDVWNTASYEWNNIAIGFLKIDKPKVLTSRVVRAQAPTYSKVNIVTPVYRGI